MTEEKIKKIEEEIRVVSTELLGFDQNIDDLREQLKERESELSGNFQEDGKWNEITSQIKKYKEEKEHAQSKRDKLKGKLEKAKENFLYHKKIEEEK
jgi:chromosome segregation ATPase